VTVAVGVAEGLASRLGQSAVVSNFGNAQAAVFAAGLLDMCQLVAACGGERSSASATSSWRHGPDRPGPADADQ
jgi:glycerol-3-phosphate dehydrogenase